MSEPGTARPKAHKKRKHFLKPKMRINRLCNQPVAAANFKTFLGGGNQSQALAPDSGKFIKS
jgi:hypothetical protein